MATIIHGSRRIRFYAAAIALAALAITLLAVSFASGPAQAQNADNTYPDPRPCGPGPNTAEAFQPEPHEVTEGHFALFDAYWEWTNSNPNQGIMHTNDCPPLMVKATQVDPETEAETVTVTRNASGIDLGEAIMHVKNVHQVDVVATNAEATAGQLSLEEYPDVRRALGLGENDPVEPGTKVWWLRLDDPDTASDETSDLGMGFSTELFDKKYWLTRAEFQDTTPMRYMFEVERYPGSDPADVPHFYAYEAPDIRAVSPKTGVKLVWDSTRVHYPGEQMKLDPGEYRALQWIFTKEGTYKLSVHLQGFVRQEKPSDAGEDWKRISGNDTETSEVKDYVIQVGKLAETEPPMFGVNRSVHDDASAGAHVGEPVRVFNLEVPKPKYTLSGDGSDHFGVISRTHPNAAQIIVAAGADLDYGSKSSYDLVLEVSDGKDHEGNNDDSIDHTIAVEIDVVQQPHAFMIASSHTPAVGDSVTLRLSVFGDLPDGVTASNLSYTVWEASRARGVLGFYFATVDATSYEGTATVRKDSAGRYKYTPEATYTLNGVEHTLHGDPVTITWRNP